MEKNQAPTPCFSTTSSQSTTALYRQNLSNFLSYTDACLRKQPHNNGPNDNDLTSWIGESSRSLALRAAAAAAASSSPTGNESIGRSTEKKVKKAKTNTQDTVTAADIVRKLPTPPQWSDFTCMTCGTFLFPPIIPDGNDDDVMIPNIGEKLTSTILDGQSFSSTVSRARPSLPGNIYLRPLKRGSTRRRRASRCKAKALHDRALVLQRRGSSSNANKQLQKDALAQENMTRMASSYRLGDGQAKNCLVLRCTFCGTKKRRKGMIIDGTKDGGKKKKEKGAGVGKGGVPAEYGRKKKQQQTLEKKRGDVTTQIRDNSDFISLSPIGVVGNRSIKAYQYGGTRQAHATKRNQNEILTSPLLEGKKKKKKKKQSSSGSKGELMDFLSSLND